MTGKQFRKLLDDGLMSQRQMARHLELNERTLRRYVEDGAKVPKVVELAARFVVSRELDKLDRC